MAGEGTTNEQRLEILLKYNPDYSRYTASDLAKLDDIDLGGVLIAFLSSTDYEDVGILVPAPFKEKYGERAVAEYAVALQKEAHARGKPELYSKEILEIALLKAVNSIDPDFRASDMTADTPATYTFADGVQANSSAAKILSYVIAANAGSSNKTQLDVIIPPEITQAMIDGNQLPEGVAKIRSVVNLSDNSIFAAGYATSGGASDAVAPFTMNYDSAYLCRVNEVVKQIFSVDGTPVPSNVAFAAGYMRQDMDEMDYDSLLAQCPNLKPSPSPAKASN